MRRPTRGSRLSSWLPALTRAERRHAPLADALWAILAIVTAALVLHSRLGSTSDPDSFYHIRHAWVYRTGGLLQTAFPWAQFSAIHARGADLWYGFHIVILPLSYLSDLVSAIYVGACITTTLTLGLVYLALRGLAIRRPLFWLFVFVLASPDLLWRLTMLRPHPLSLGLVLVLFSCLVNDAWRWRRVVIFLACAALTWIHLGISWVAPFVAAVVTLVRAVHGQRFDWRALLALSLGWSTGWLLRPNPIGAAQLAYVQIVELLLAKRAQVPLSFGVELVPLRWLHFADQLIPISVLGVVALGYLTWLIANRRYHTLSAVQQVAVGSSLLVSAAFLFQAITVARRADELFVAFGVVFVSLLATRLQADRSLAWRPLMVKGVAALALLAMPFQTLYRFESFAQYAVTSSQPYHPDRFKAVALWLKEHALPGEIVFNIDWWVFAQLFFWNPDNYYVNGMDPIFEYAYNPALYWKNHFLASGRATANTCGSPACGAGEVTPTYDVLKRDFRAGYLVIEKGRQTKLHRYLASDPRFTNVFETERDTVFKIR